MNEENITIEINVEVKVNGVTVPDTQVKINSVIIDEIIIPNVVIS